MFPLDPSMSLSLAISPPPLTPGQLLRPFHSLHLPWLALWAFLSLWCIGSSLQAGPVFPE